MARPSVKFLAACLVVLFGSCAAPCHQPLSALCEHCPTFDELVSAAEPTSGCDTIRLVRCDGRRSLVIPGKTSTRFFFDDQGTMVGAEQSTDTLFDCSPEGTSRSFGEVFDCTGGAEQWVCIKG